MKSFLMNTAAIGTLMAGFGSSTAMAIPYVYQCKIVDYLQSGPETTEFYYVIGSGYRSAKSNHSEVRLSYSKSDQILHVSIRPMEDTGTYARREDNGAPMQISLTHVATDYAATVRCQL